MKKRQGHTSGLKQVVEKCRNEFRKPENIEHYSEEDYREAERKYVRFCLTGDPLYTEHY